jgi:hypothetical protein
MLNTKRITQLSIFFLQILLIAPGLVWGDEQKAKGSLVSVETVSLDEGPILNSIPGNEAKALGVALNHFMTTEQSAQLGEYTIEIQDCGELYCVIFVPFQENNYKIQYDESGRQLVQSGGGTEYGPEKTYRINKRSLLIESWDYAK